MKELQKYFVHQQDQSDCGVACLLSVIRYYGGDAKLERLREISGTSRQGTTLLGLYQASEQLALKPQAFEAEADNLKAIGKPCILHVIIDDKLQHYIVVYAYQNGQFIVADPAFGIKSMSEMELGRIWKTKALLILEPADHFVKATAAKKEQRAWFRKLIEEDLNVLAVSAVLGIFIASLSVSTAIFLQRLIDDILPEKQEMTIIVGLVLLGFLLVVKAMMGYIRQYFLLRQTREFNNRIVHLFFGRLLRLPKSFFDNRKTGELIARMNDTMRIQNAIAYIGGNVMIDILFVLVATLFMMYYSTTIGFIAFLYVPVYALIVYLLNTKIITTQKEVMQAFARNESNYVDTIQGVGTIKSANREEHFTGITRKVYDFFQEKVYGLGTVRINFTAVTEVTGSIILVTVIGLSSMMVLRNELKLGEMAAIMQMLMMLMPAATRLAMTNIQLQEARIAFDRMYEFASVKPEYEEEEENAKTRIEEFESLEVRDLAFRFPGRMPLLKGISFQLKKGEMIALLGESGCGKSTTLQILQKFYAYESGEIRVNHTTWNAISMYDWRRLTAVVPQQIKIFNASLLENICLSDPVVERQAIVDFCREYGFEKFFSSLPQGYVTLLGEEGINISGGQQQLVALARALYKRPQVLILDEATSAMDRNTESFVMDLLERLRTELSIILVTHRVKTAEQADRIYVLEEGLITAHGSSSELMQYDNFYSWSVRGQLLSY